MAIEDIFRALEEQADAECDEIARAANGQAEAILAEAKAEADRIKTQRLKATDEVVQRKAGKAVNAAKLDNKKELAAVRERVVQKVFDDAATKLDSLRSGNKYEGIFKALAAEALSGVNGDCTMQVDPADAKLAEKVVSALNSSCGIDPSLKTSGGMVVSTDDGRVLRRNTFESRLAKSQEFTYARVSEILG